MVNLMVSLMINFVVNVISEAADVVLSAVALGKGEHGSEENFLELDEERLQGKRKQQYIYIYECIYIYT